jgi:chromate transporter
VRDGVEASGTVDPSEVTLGALFMGFLKVGICGFGGVLAWAHQVAVEDRRWLSEQEFAATMGLCQFLPGPNVVNLSFYLGGRFRGPLGAAAAFTGLMAAPMVIGLCLAGLYAEFGDDPIVRRAFVGISAAAAGLLIAAALKIGKPLARQPIAIAFAVGVFALVGVLRFSMIPVLLALAPISVAVAWVRRR